MRNLFFFAVFFVSLHPTFGQKDVSVETIDKAKRTVIPIVCGYIDDEKEFKVAAIAGTGFFVDQNGRFITDAHVLNSWDQTIKTRHACSAAIYIPDHGWGHFEPRVSFQYFPFAQCQTDSNVDLAVCQPVENPFTSKRVKENIAIASFDIQTWPEGTPVAFTGFPLESSTPISSKGFIAGFQIISEGTAGFDYAVDKAAWPGASGSPLYLANGKVVAIMRAAGENAGSGISFARSAVVISDFLSKHPYTAQPTQPQQGESTQH